MPSAASTAILSFPVIDIAATKAASNNISGNPKAHITAFRPRLSAPATVTACPATKLPASVQCTSTSLSFDSAARHIFLAWHPPQADDWVIRTITSWPSIESTIPSCLMSCAIYASETVYPTNVSYFCVSKRIKLTFLFEIFLKCRLIADSTKITTFAPPLRVKGYSNHL